MTAITTAAPGDKKWEYSTSAWIAAGPALGPDGLIYVAAGDGRLHAVETASGKRKWLATSLNNPASGPAVGVDGTVFIAGISSSGNSTLHAFNGTNGTRKWTFIIGGYVPLAPAISADGDLFAAHMQGKVIALSQASGTKKWEFSTEGELRHAPVLGQDGTVYIGTLSGRFVALNPETRAPYWTVSIGTPLWQPPAIGPDGTLFISGSDGTLRALDGATGRLKWNTGLELGTAMAPTFTAPVLGPNHGLFAASVTTLYALDTRTGGLLWNTEIGARGLFYTGPTVAADGTVYLGSSEAWLGRGLVPDPTSNVLYAVDGSTGLEKWSFGTDGPSDLPPVIGADGTLYICSANQKLYAVEGSAGPLTNVWSKLGRDARNTSSAELPGGPVILSSPSQWDVAEGRSARLGAAIGGTRPFKYQWFFDQTPIASGTNAQLLIESVRFADAGEYTFEVANASGSARATATLQVGYALDISTFGDGVVRRDPVTEVVTPGTVVTLVPEPRTGKEFLGWSGDASGIANPLKITVDRNLAVAAEFAMTPGVRLWRFATGDRVAGCPSIARDGTVYFGTSGRGTVYAVDGATGVVKWEFERVRGSQHSPALGADGTVYIGSDKLYALDRTNGRLKWAFNPDSEVLSSAVVGADDTVYFSASSGVFALNSGTGQRKWRAGQGGGSLALSADGTLYSGAGDGYLYALDALSGQTKWRFRTGGVASPGIGADGTVYIGSSDASLYAVNGKTGEKRWSVDLRAPISGSPVIGPDGLLFIASDEGLLYALHTATGAEKWRFRQQFGFEGLTPALGEDGTVFAVSPQIPGIVALDAATGARKWVHPYEGDPASSPALGSHRFLVTGTGSGVVGIATDSGLSSGPWPKLRGDGQNTGSHQVPGAPIIRTGPDDVALAVASTGSLEAYASGTQPLTYQWAYEGKPLAGATNAVLIFTDIQLTNAGSYALTVGNAFGTVTTSNSILTVGFPLQIRTDGLGAVRRNPARDVYSPGTRVELTAVPADGRRFLGWSGAVTGATNPISLEITDATAAVAHFEVLIGDPRWAFETGGAVRSSPALGTNGLVYFGSADERVYAVDLATGHKRWDARMQGPVIAAPAVTTNGMVITASMGGVISAFDGETGRARWTAQFGEILSSPAIGADVRVYISTRHEGLRALDVNTGRPLWQSSENWVNAYGSPSIGPGGTIYCSSGGFLSGQKGNSGHLFAMDGNNGRVRWTFQSVNNIHASPALGADGTVFIPSYDKLIYALDPTTGAKKWEFLAGDSISSSPAIGPDGSLYFGGNDGRLYALDSATGKEKWRFLTGDTIHSSPAVAEDGTVVFGSYDKNVYGLDGKTGSLKWRFATGGLVLSSPIIASDGTVLIGSHDGKLYALHGSAPLAASPWPAFRGDARRTGSAEQPGPPVVVQLPADRLVPAGTGTVFDAVVQGSRPMRFQWLMSGEPVPGATNALLQFNATRVSDTAEYTLVASNALGEARASAKLEVGFTLMIQPQGGGDVVRTPDQAVYLPGTAVALAAQPNPGRKFLGWRGDASGMENPFRILMDDHKAVAAKFDAPPGDRLWEVPASSGFSPTTIGLDNTIYIGSLGREVIALDGDNGLVKWNFNLGAFARSASTAADGTVIVLADPNIVFALDGATGQQKWKATVPGFTGVRPAIGADGTVYLPTENQNSARLIALNGTNGAVKWRASSANSFSQTAPVVGLNGFVYITTASFGATACTSSLSAIDSSNGTVRWTAPLGNCFGSHAVLGGHGAVYAISAAGALRSFDAETGQELWTTTLPDQTVGRSPIVGPDETIYILGDNSLLIAVDGVTGQLRTQFKLPQGLGLWSAPPALTADGTLIAMGFNKLFGLDAATGSAKWEVAVPGIMHFPLIVGPAGTIYARVDAGGEPRLAAIQGASPLADAPWPVFTGDAANTSALADRAIRVLGLDVSQGEVRLALKTRPGRAHHLEFTDSLVHPLWTRTATAAGDGNEQMLTDSKPAVGARFYRVRLE